MASEDKLPTESYKGVRDFYPEEQAVLSHFFNTVRGVLERMGYVEYGASILEPAELYRAKGAENEEIIDEQTYTFTDRGGREVTLRPEMTPSVARLVAGRRRDLGFPLRLYSIPNVFRYERPQRGRLREHWQLNADIFGSRSSHADAEILLLAHAIMRAFGAEERDFTIAVSNRSFLHRLAEQANLSPERTQEFFALLDRKAKMPHEEFAEALTGFGVAEEALQGGEAPDEVLNLIKECRELGVANVVFDPSIVRGFNYYTGMVFEVYDTNPDNNRSLFGGGRYDNLTALFDDEPTPGVGFGMGDVTMQNFLEMRGLLPKYAPPTTLYLALPSITLAPQAQSFAERLRTKGVSIAVDFGEKKLGDQIKTAAKHRVPFLVVFGEDELSSGRYTVRDLASGTETSLTEEELSSFFNRA